MFDLLYKSLPVNQILINLLQSLFVIPGQFYFLPHASWESRSLHSLHVQIADTFLLPHSGVLTVSQRTGLSVTQPCKVVLISEREKKKRDNITFETHGRNQAVSMISVTCCSFRDVYSSLNYTALQSES